MPENEISIEYKEAVSLMDSAIIEKNHQILDSAVKDIEDSVLICENPEIELIQMRSEVFFLMPDYLKNPTDPNLLKFKKDIKLYKDGYENLCKKLNDYIEKVSESLKKLLDPSNNLKKEIEQIIKQFEETVKNLCVPLISEQQGLNTINSNKLSESEKDDLIEQKLDVTYKINEFKKESENLNKQYNRLFNKINQAVQILCNMIKDIPSSLTYLQDKIEEGMSKYEEILEDDFSDLDKNKNGYFQNLLFKVKESFEIINNKMDKIIREINDKINNLEIQYKKREESFFALKDNSKQIIEKLKEKSNSIKKNIIEIRKTFKEKEIKLPEIKISEIIIEKLIKPMQDSFQSIKNEVQSVSKGVQEIRIEIIPKIINHTSLDFLFIIDTTGSMEPYVDVTKKKLIKVMEIIKSEYNEIEINLAFIGYKDICEIFNKDFLVIPFTQNYEDAKEKINKIEVGGGDDTAEDIAWAFEKALEMKWTNEIRVAFLVTDAPCHGKQYHKKNLLDYYPEEVPNREKMENLVNKMVSKNISLICIKLNDDTNIMYGKFKEIYKKNKNIIFDIVPINLPENLIEMVKNTIKMIQIKK